MAKENSAVLEAVRHSDITILIAESDEINRQLLSEMLEEEGYQVLAEADVVAVTGTSLINHTFGRIIASCQPGSFKVMLGPSTPLSPILFDFGIDVIGGALVEEETTVLTMVDKGIPFRRLKGVRTVVMIKDALQVC